MFMFFYWCWRQSWSQCWHYASVNTHRKVRCWPSLGLMRSADFFLHVFLCIQPPLFLTSFAVPAAQKSLQSKVWSSPDKRMFFLVISEFFNQLSRLSGTLKSKETYPWTLYHKVLIDVCCWDDCPSSRFFSLCTQSLSYWSVDSWPPKALAVHSLSLFNSRTHGPLVIKGTKSVYFQLMSGLYKRQKKVLLFVYSLVHHGKLPGICTQSFQFITLQSGSRCSSRISKTNYVSGHEHVKHLFSVSSLKYCGLLMSKNGNFLCTKMHRKLIHFFKLL